MKKTVMIVDDSSFVTAEMKAMLDNSDFIVVANVRSGEEALEQLGSIRPDLVTMDIVLPGMDGMEATENILRQWPATKVLIISSLAYDETVKGAKTVGASGSLFKPFRKEQLLDALKSACE